MSRMVRTRSGWYGTRHGGGAAKPFVRERHSLSACRLFRKVLAHDQAAGRVWPARCRYRQLRPGCRPLVRGLVADRARRLRRIRATRARTAATGRVRVLGIDETRRGKPKWAQDADTGRWQMVADWWQTGIVDALGTGGMLAQVDGRTSSSVTGWLDTQPDSWKSSITHVAIDLSGSYLKAVRSALPDAVVVADRLHLVRLANDTLTKVRQEATRTVRGRRGRAKDPEWANRRKLLTGHERLSEPASTRCGTS